MGVDQTLGDLVEVEVLGVDESCVVAAVTEHGGVEVGAGVDAHVGGSEQLDRAQGQEVGRTRARPDEVDGHVTTYDVRVADHWVIAREGVHPVKVPIGAACSTCSRVSSPPSTV